MPPYDRVEWSVPYEAGTLEARGFRGGELVETSRVETTGPATQLVLTPDRSQLSPGGADATVFTVEARDARGRVVPTACNQVTFAIAGGRILGVGNGDPSCHEPDQVHPAITRLNVENWRGRIAPAGTELGAAAPASLEPLRKVGNWLAPLPKENELYELAAEFTLRDLPAGASIELFLPTLGTTTTVQLNGRTLATGVDTTKAGPSLRLSAEQIVVGVNHVQLLVTPFADSRRRLPEADRLGALRLTTAAPATQRSLFNGFAQVIVEAGSEPGKLTLSASADDLAPANSSIEVAR